MDITSIIAIIVILLGGVLGFKRGLLKSFKQLLLVYLTVFIIYLIKPFVIDFMVSNLLLFTFRGYPDIYPLGIMLYQGVSFVFLFILVYSILNIIAELTSLNKFIGKLDIIVPYLNRILGAVVGILLYINVVYVIGYCMMSIAPLQKYALDSPVVNKIEVYTPIIGKVFRRDTFCFELIHDALLKEDLSSFDKSLEIVRAYISTGSVSSKAINKAIASGRLHMDDLVIG